MWTVQHDGKLAKGVSDADTVGRVGFSKDCTARPLTAVLLDTIYFAHSFQYLV